MATNKILLYQSINVYIEGEVYTNSDECIEITKCINNVINSICLNSKELLWLFSQTLQKKKHNSLFINSKREIYFEYDIIHKCYHIYHRVKVHRVIISLTIEEIASMFNYRSTILNRWRDLRISNISIEDDEPMDIDNEPTTINIY